MSRRTVVATLLAASAAVAGTTSLARQAPVLTGPTRTVYVTATDSKGKPVMDLTGADFRVKEDGQGRPVQAAVLSRTGMTIVLMIDDSGLGLQSIREGAGAFVTRLSGKAQISLVTTGGRNIKVTDFTTSTPALIAAINKTYARNASGAFLLDGFFEVARSFAAVEIPRPIIVSVAVEGQEFSDTKVEDVLNALLRSRAQLYVIRLGNPVIGQSNALGMEHGESLANESVRLNAVLGRGPARSGGRSEQLIQHTGIPPLMDQIAIELADQYAVTYTTAGTSASDVKLDVETSRRGVRLRAPTRVGTGR